MGKQNRFIQKAMKNADRNADAKKLDPIQTDLLEMDIPTVREKTIYNEKFTQKRHERNPDLTVTLDDSVLEHDTVKVHGELGFENKKTLQRNADYIRAGISFSVINADLAKHLNLDESKLCAYLYFHEKMKQNAVNYCNTFSTSPLDGIPNLE